MAIYENVKTKCRYANRTISSVEHDLKFPRGSIYKWNEHPPGINKVKAVADILGCTIDDLIGDTLWKKNTST